MTIGENIRKFRKERNLTQKQLGERCGIDEANIRKYELGNANPKFETIQKIAKALEVYLGDIYEDGNLPNSKTFDEYYQTIKQENIPREEKQKKILDYATNILYKELEFENKNIAKPDHDTLFYGELIIRDLTLLNEAGQKKVATYTKDLTKIPEYQKEQK